MPDRDAFAPKMEYHRTAPNQHQLGLVGAGGLEPASARTDNPRPPTYSPTKFMPGTRVRHPQYGDGTVVAREGNGAEAKLTISFPGFGLKKIIEQYCQLKSE